MPDNAVVFGDVIDPAQKQQFKQKFPDCTDKVIWCSESDMPESNPLPSTVFIDLDDSRFKTSAFLASFSADKNDIRLVGKLDDPEIDEVIRVSKLGISEILTSQQCCERIQKLLSEEKEEENKKELESTRFNVNALIGDSKPIREIRRMIKILSDVDFPSALILGETGTGKSLISKILHNTGIRKKHNFVEVNCSAIPDELFESEIFGHVKGSFTDARTDKVGLFEYAQKGTLFLDEVGTLSHSAQAKLLKILEDKKLRRVGDVEESNIDVRVVAATNLDLQKAIENDTFREDLFFRLNLLAIQIPPLREIAEDIPEIASHYLKFYSVLYGKPDLGITSGALDEMQKYRWPGNVRELSNIIERAVLLTKSRIIKAGEINSAFKNNRIDLSDRQQIVIDIPPHGLSLKEIEQHIVKQVLNYHNWNKSKTAEFLQISRPRLRRILKEAGLEQNRRKR